MKKKEKQKNKTKKKKNNKEDKKAKIQKKRNKEIKKKQKNTKYKQLIQIKAFFCSPFWRFQSKSGHSTGAVAGACGKANKNIN